MSEFDSLVTISDWGEHLAGMLDEASAATRAKDDAKRLSIAKRLREYVKKSPPLLEGTARLDALALEASTRLGDSVIDDAVERIRGRTAEFLALKKQIEAITAVAERDARLIRLEPARAAVDALTGAVRAIEDLDMVLVEGTDDELRKRLTTLLKTLEAAKAQIEKIGKET